MPRLARAPGVIARRVAGRLVLVSPAVSSSYELNEVGARVWELAEGRSPDDIVAVLADELDAPRATIAADVDAFVAALAREGMLLTR